MPRFLLSVFILALVSLAGFGFVVLRTSPNQAISVALFLTAFFFSTASALSLIFFFVHKKFFFKPKTFAALGPVVTADDLRPIFRTSLRRAVLLAALLIILLVLQRFL